MQLSQDDARDLLSKYSIRLIDTILFREISQLHNPIFPAVLKVDSPDILHKTEYGLVFTNIKDTAMLGEKADAAKKILNEKKVTNYRLALQRMAGGVELIIGMKRDKTFGPVIVFGLGGVFVEVTKDVSMGISPLTKNDCITMIESIKGKKILDGYRGTKKVDKGKLIEILMRLSTMSLKEKNILEVDFNPVMADGSDAVIVDARIIVGD